MASVISEEEALEQARTIEERIDSLGQEIMANAFVAIDALKKGGKKQKESEIIKQEELQRQFKIIQNTYAQLKKMGRISPTNTPADFTTGLLDAIKRKKSTMGSIVTKIDK